MPPQPFTTIAWDDGVVLLDQTKLPDEEVYLRVTTVEDLVAAIQRLSIRGAPAIGVAGGYGVALAARQFPPDRDRTAFLAAVATIRAARPTAVNLALRVDEVLSDVEAGSGPAAEEALKAANDIRAAELASSVGMGERGYYAVLDLCDGGPVTAMTICNTGGLASVERGTALAVIQTLHERGQLAEALALETRPLLQGARLTAWELQRMGAPFRLLVDSAGPFLLHQQMADVVLIGADRIAANGDTANKIGSFALALGARAAGIPFIVVAPESTVDLDTASGPEIEIEDRGVGEVVSVHGMRIAPDDAGAVNPAFDVTPAELISVIVTDRRVVHVHRGEAIDRVSALDPADIE